MEARDRPVDAGRGDREVVGVGDHRGLEAEVDRGDVEVRSVDQEQKELVGPQDAAHDEAPGGVGDEGAQRHPRGVRETAQRPAHEEHLTDQTRQRRQDPDGGRDQQGDRVGDPTESPASAAAPHVGDHEGLDEEHVHQRQRDVGAHRGRRPAGGEGDQHRHHQDRRQDQREQGGPHAHEATGGAVAPVRGIADEPVDGSAGDLAEPRHGHGDADDEGGQGDAADVVAAELGADDRIAGSQEDGRRHGLQHAPQRRDPRTSGAVPRTADRRRGVRAQVNGRNLLGVHPGGRRRGPLDTADRRAGGGRGEQHQRRGGEGDQGDGGGRDRGAQRRQDDHRLHGGSRQEDGDPASARAGVPGTDRRTGGGARGGARDHLIQGSWHHSDPSSTGREPVGIGDSSGTRPRHLPGGKITLQ